MKRFLAASLVFAVLASAAVGADTYNITFANEAGRAAEPEHIPFASLSNTAVSGMEFSSGQLVKAHRTWAPFVISHTLLKGQSSLFAQGTNMPNMTITVNETVNGASVPYFTIQLTGATISRNTTGSTPTVEVLNVSFTKITWTWVKGGITVNDTWNEPEH
jgi:type VI protein secretion system component Hcp